MSIATATSGSYISGSTLSYIAPPSEKQVKVAIFKVVRDKETNRITQSVFSEERWVCKKPGISLELATMHLMGRVIDPETEVIKEILSIEL